MANALHTHPNKSQLSIIGRATLAVAKGNPRKVDVIKCVQQPDKDSEELNTGEPRTTACACRPPARPPAWFSGLTAYSGGGCALTVPVPVYVACTSVSCSRGWAVAHR